MGAWIEIISLRVMLLDHHVAPHVGAWIEIDKSLNNGELTLSHPTWVRGLKSERRRDILPAGESHPTWVRGLKFTDKFLNRFARSRTPRGCVD